MTTPPQRKRLPVASPFTPGSSYRSLRRFTQAFTILVILVAPLLGGWQRLDSNHLSAWDGRGWDLPAWVLARLPAGDAPGRAYDVNQALGGGIAADYVGIPAVDPVAGAIALASGEATGWLWLAWSLPLLLALLLGRVFCGWLCPYGTLARLLEAGLSRLPLRPPRRVVPESRPLRWLLLVACVLVGALGVPGALYLLLPHALLQQSVYSAWLMGGGGAVFGWFAGLVAAGILLGPTVYCSTLCPTGAALSLPRKRKLLQVTLAEPAACGTHCELCSRACWLSLSPASGDPGPDCDGCTRCFAVCPRDNLRVGWHGGRTRMAAALLLAFWAAPDAAQADVLDRANPGLILEGARQQGDVTASLALVDLREFRLDADDQRTEQTVRVSLVLWRGERPASEQTGRQVNREVYRGPLSLRIDGEDASATAISFEGATAPLSTPRRNLFRRDVLLDLRGGERVTLEPITGWLEQPVHWVVPATRRALAWTQTARASLGSFLVFLGLMALALTVPRRRTDSAAPRSP